MVAAAEASSRFPGGGAARACELRNKHLARGELRSCHGTVMRTPDYEAEYFRVCTD